MSFELLVALRYLKAKRKHAAISVITLVSIAGVSAGVGALVVALAINEGFRQDLQEKLLGTTQPHVTLQPKSRGLANYMNVVAAVEKVDGVVAAAPALYDTVLISSANGRQGVIVKGVIGKREAQIADFAGTLPPGTLDAFDKPSDDGAKPPILIGRELSHALGGVEVGDPLQLLSDRTEQSPRGQELRPMYFQVAGIFDSGLYEHDSRWVYVPMDSLQRLLQFTDPKNGPMVMAIEIRISDIYDAQRMGTQIVSDLAEKTGQSFIASDWIAMNTKIFQALKLERLVMFITIGLIVMVAALNIVGSLTMMVLEKSRDIAILMAMGATRKTIRQIFIWQGVIIGVVGTFIGLILGNLLSYLADKFHWLSLDREVYSIAYVPFRASAMDSIVIAAVAIAISFLATLYPSAEAARLEPVETLRYE